jgi:hypothetical protein
MRKINLMLYFCLISVMTYAQKFETNLTVAPELTFGRIIYYQDEVGTAFGISGAIQEFYNITEKFAIGSELNYSNTRNKLINRLIADMYDRYESTLNIQTLNMPINIRYKTLKNWIIQGGYGVAYALDSKLKVDNVYKLSSDNALKRISVTEKSDDLKRNFNSYYTIAFGKGFTIRKQEILIQVYFKQTSKDYHFSHGTTNPSDGLKYNYAVKPHLIGLSLGIKL